MADRVDAAVHPMQPPSLQPTIDPPAAKAQGGELSPRHDTMLSLGEVRDGQIPTRGKKCIATMKFLPHVADGRANAAPRLSSMTVF